MNAPMAFPQFRASAMPATLGLIGAMVIAFVVGWFPEAGSQVAQALAFDGTLAKPWTLVTYPFVLLGGQVLFVAFLCLWLALIGNQLEPQLGSWKLLAAFFAFTLLGGIALLVAQSPAIGPGLPVAALTVLWCALNPLRTIMVMFVLPLQARWLALVTAVFVFFGVGPGNVLAGSLSLAPLALAWFGAPFAAGTRPNRPQVEAGRGAAKSPAEFDAYMEKVRNKEKEREDRERLRRLLEGGQDDSSSGR